MDRTSLARLLEEGESVERIARRFGKHPSTISYWLRKHALEPPLRGRHRPRGGLARDQLEPLVDAGMTIAEIALAVDRSSSTVRYWLGRYSLKTQHSVGRRPSTVSERAKAAGCLEAEMECVHHGHTTFFLEGRGYYRCRRCRAEAVTRRRRRVKAQLVEEAGGACAVCGFDQHLAALQFHHLDRATKLMTVSAQGWGVGIEQLRAEAQKCVLLCSNCHVLIENRAVDLPLESPTRPAGSTDRPTLDPG